LEIVWGEGVKAVKNILIGVKAGMKNSGVLLDSAAWQSK
jgi:hypothetical protein